MPSLFLGTLQLLPPQNWLGDAGPTSQSYGRHHGAAPAAAATRESGPHPLEQQPGLPTSLSGVPQRSWSSGRSSTCHSCSDPLSGSPPPLAGRLVSKFTAFSHSHFQLPGDFIKCLMMGYRFFLATPPLHAPFLFSPMNLPSFLFHGHPLPTSNQFSFLPKC